MSCGTGHLPTGGFIADEDLAEGGYIVRRKYVARRRGKTVRVPARRITDRGARGKWRTLHGPGIEIKREGDLSRVGYSVAAPATRRHVAIRKAVRAYGPTSTFRKLQAVATFTKRTSKGKSRKFATDRDWLKKMFM